MEKFFIIGYGLSGGFGGIRDYEVIQVDTIEEAEKWAWESACESYDNYAGMHGLRSIEEIMEEDEIEDENEAEQVYIEERESWLDYSAQPYSKEYEEKVSGCHYSNPFTEMTDKLS